MSWRDELEKEQNNNSTVKTKQDLLNLCETQQSLIDKLNNENETLNRENQQLNNQVKVLTVLQSQLDKQNKLLATWERIITANTTANDDLETELQALQTTYADLQTAYIDLQNKLNS